VFDSRHLKTHCSFVLATALTAALLGESPVLAQGAPDQAARTARSPSGDDAGWFAFDPGPDPFTADAALDLRFLNERVAGEGGFIGVKDGQFVHMKTGQPVRFWAVNGPPSQAKDPQELRRVARLLAKRGVNLVRLHGGYFNERGETEPGRVKRALAVVEALKAEGIYTHLSIYFPLWLRPKPGTPWLEGYDGSKHPFAALLFNPRFQEQYRAWWTALLLTPSETTGKTLVEEPAVAGVEMQNEDSFFFWTFSVDNIPGAELRLLEAQFAGWLARRYGSLDAAFAKWNGLKTKRDEPAAGRVSFRPLWNMFHEKTPRDLDTARFLFETQKRFYVETSRFLRKLGFKGLITASNWATASPEVFGPLEKLSYTVGDFIDRHGYFSCWHKGPNSEWSVRDGHTYADRSALRFDPEEPGKPRAFVHPVMDPHYDNKPSMNSETTWNRPNRFRSEAPLYLAAYGALQDSAAIVHFALDGSNWAVKPGFFMQPWTLMSPAMMGQFPAAALIFRRGLIAKGQVLADVSLNIEELLALRGTPLPQDASFDELRLQDVPRGTEVKPGQRLDPLLHYAGRSAVRFGDRPSATALVNLAPFVDRAQQTVRSTTGELRLDYGRGVLVINAPSAQGVSGDLRAAGTCDLRDIVIRSPLELGHLIAVSLDDQPLATSGRILLQAMSEEKTTGFLTEPATPGVKRILSIGHDPWLAKNLEGVVRFKRADASQLKVTPLNFNGYPNGSSGAATAITLQPATAYYLISR
jgi:hypothetical protein